MKKVPFMSGILLALSAGAGVSVGENVLFNADFIQDGGAGAPAGWYYHLPYKSAATLTARPLERAVEMTFTNDAWAFVAQNHLRLKAEGKYRLSAEVQTTGDATYNIWLWNHSWRKDWQSTPLPLNTTGRWVKVEWTPNVPSCAVSNNYTIGIAVKPPAKGARLLMRNLRLEALDEATASQTSTIEAKWRKPKMRIVPISAVLAAIPTTGDLSCYWGGVPKGGVTTATLVGSIDGRWSARAPFDAQGRAHLKFGALPGGDRTLKLEVRGRDGALLAADDYAIYVRDPISGPRGRKLNNFVTQLVNQPLKDGEVRFFCPEEGWVWFALDGVGSAHAKGYLDDYQFSIVHRRGEEPELENQRYLNAGWHTFRVRGAQGGRLRIHAVKTLVVMAYDCGRTPFSAMTLRFGERFHGLSTFNTLNDTSNFFLDDILTKPDAAYYLERGMRLSRTLPYFVDFMDPGRMDADAAYARIRRDLLRACDYYFLNENPVRAFNENHLAYAEALWRLARDKPEAEVGTYICDPIEKVYFNLPQYHTTEIAAMINTGRGRSHLFLEVYTPTAATEAESDTFFDAYARLLKSAHDLVPASKGHLNLFMATCFRFGAFTSYIAPEVDFKAHWVRMLRTYATRADFADNGGCALYGSHAGDEELQRWCTKCLHYYCVEGGTGDLAQEYGYRWHPGLVANCDFEEGLTNWSVRAATPTSIQAERIANFGRRVQQRQNMFSPGKGDSVAVFTSSASTPNALAQEIRGLIPGRYYALAFVTADRDAMEKPTDRLDAGKFSARLEGAEEVTGLRDLIACPTVKSTPVAKRTWEHRYVFKATAPTARLVITDRADDGAAPNAGARTALNYIMMRPYYLEKDQTVESVIECLKRR